MTLPEPMRVVRAHRWEADGSVDDMSVRFVTATLPVAVSDRLTVLEIADANQIAARQREVAVSARDGSSRSSRHHRQATARSR